MPRLSPVLRRPAIDMVSFHGIQTVSPAMKDLFELIGRVARTEIPVLIRGETGTGKELVAKALHAESRRGRGPFRAVNCATLTPELLASELFGHVRGAFTGAVRDRPGLFKLAHRGTIFLDEIAEMPLEVQARFLRVLQERSFIPLGAAEPIRADVRVLSATHVALRRAVEAGRFREDLMYRVRVVPLYLPRLAEREGDVVALVWHFIDTLNRDRQEPVEGVRSAAMGALRTYGWPGNVRELRNALEYAFAVGQGPVVELEDLPPELRGEGPPEAAGAGGGLRSAERRRLLDALDRAGGRKGEAARLLGMSRTTLWRKLREHGLGGD